MIIGVGTDVIEIKRIKKLYKKSGDKFLKRVFSDKEIEASKKYESKKKFYGYLAKRFAAKEAISKALGCGIGSEVSFTEVEILNEKSGKPIARISGKSARKIGKAEIHLSLSDDDKSAIAFVVISRI